MTEAARGGRASASSYSTGGGGTVLEHRYGAVLLAYLLSGDPMPGLRGDGFALERVAFQAARHPVDDFEVTGRAADDAVMRWLLAVRRAPNLVPSDEKSVSLIRTFLQVLEQEPEAVCSGERRLGLVVSGPQTHATQLSELADLAVDHDTNDDFRAQAAYKSRAVRDRLGYVDQMVADVAARIGTSTPAPELTWRLLASLTVHQAELEGAQGLRSHAVATLRPVTATGAVGAADDLFRRLEELADTYAPTAGTVTETVLRRRLIGFPLARSRSHRAGWELLDRAAARLRERIRSQLSSSDEAAAPLRLPRDRARYHLAAAITATATAATTATGEASAAGKAGAVLVVTGEPDVGKSALVLDALDQLQHAGDLIPVAVALDELPTGVGELEARLGGALEEILAAQTSGAPRVLVLDGAEAVQAAHERLLGTLARAASHTGMGVVAITRQDALDAVTAALGEVGLQPGRHVVPRLGDEDVTELVVAFPTLEGLSQDPRRAWVLGRLGLVDLLLRARLAETLPPGPVCEADVLRVLWAGLVRHHGTNGPGGASPDGRAVTLLALAGTQLDPATPFTPPEPAALGSLRSDGLLAPPSPWDDRARFASDLVRDLALARKLHTDGWGALRAAGAPRWAVRAARLACQARLVEAAATGQEQPALANLQQELDAVAAESGARWAELPVEAVLALAGAHDILPALWPGWLTDDHLLPTALRLAVHNFPITGPGAGAVGATVADPLVLAPLVELVVADTSQLLVPRRTRRPQQDSIPELLVTWLRATTQPRASASEPVRARLRDRLLEPAPDADDALVIEMLATLGPDLDTATEHLLRDVAATHPEALAPAVERPHATRSMARHQPGLLLSLAEDYYIEPTDQGYTGWHDEGVREHELDGGFGFGWWRGPFLDLLEHVPVAAVAFIQRMLNTAAQRRAQHMSGDRDPVGEPLRSGAALDLPGFGVRFCHGDDHVWYWYRSRSVGPYPCKSALLALERFIEHTLQPATVPLERLAALLLEGCTNLAMPGLVFDMLVRHLERDETAVDRWLVQPAVWEMEFVRAAEDLLGPLLGPDSPVTAPQRRRWTPREVAQHLMAAAIWRADQQRIDQIAALGPALLAAATPPGGSARPAVSTWTAHLDPANYHTARTPTGRLALMFLPPAKLASAPSEQQAMLARGQLQLRLWNTYGGDPDRTSPVENLIEDLTAAQAMATEPPSALDVALDDGLAAIAATALRAHAEARVTVPDHDLGWAAELLLTQADDQTRPRRRRMLPDERGAARSIGIGLVALLHPRLAPLDIAPARRDEAIAACASSGDDDLRDGLVTGLAPLWSVPCDPDTTGAATCVHREAWAVVEQLAEQAAGDEPASTGPAIETLPAIAAQDLQTLLLTAAIVASADATHSACVTTAEQARDGHAVLLDAHRRHAQWLRHTPATMQQVLSHHEQVTRVLLAHAAAGDPAPLREHLAAYLDHPAALQLLLGTALHVVTHYGELRAFLTDLWPPLMDQVMDHIEQHPDSDSPNAQVTASLGERTVPPPELVPHPRARLFSSDARQTVADASSSWISPEAVATAVQRWIRASPPSTAAVEALLGLVATADPKWQTTSGLAWVTTLIDGRYQNVSRSAQLVDWIQNLHSDGLSPDSKVLNPLVDGLITHGASRLIELQRRDELTDQS